MAMKEYEVVHEIFNLCSGNQMRDVFIEEIELPENGFEDYIRKRHREKELVLEREDLPNGNVIYVVMTAEIKQRYSFTEI